MKQFVNRYMQMKPPTGFAVSSCSVASTLRVNTLKISVKKLIQRLEERGVKLQKVAHLQHAFTYDAPFSLGATEEYLLGYYYLQEAASQLPVTALQKVSAILGISLQTVLDMAAAPGSKTTQLASVMKNNGKIIATDISEKRIAALANNLERCGVTNTFVYQKDGLHVADFGIAFDAVLLDAPCSGNFVIDKKWFKKRNVLDFAEKGKQQKQLLAAAWNVLRPGGVLVYSTCSLEPEENEGVLQSLPEDAQIIDSGLSVGEPGLTSFGKKKYRSDMVNARRIWPSDAGMQGFS